MAVTRDDDHLLLDEAQDMDARIDGMSYLDDPGAAMTAIHLADGERG